MASGDKYGYGFPREKDKAKPSGLSRFDDQTVDQQSTIPRVEIVFPNLAGAAEQGPDIAPKRCFPATLRSGVEDDISD